MAGLGRAGYVCEVLTGSGPLVLVLTGRKLSVSELLAIGGPPARRCDGGRFLGLGGRLPGESRRLFLLPPFPVGSGAAGTPVIGAQVPATAGTSAFAVTAG
jgi:hypothetical protein